MTALDRLSGATLGQYHLRDLLGQGGMGAVYRAAQPVLNREVAVKVIRTALSTESPDYLQRFIREAQTAAALEHPHIVAVHDFGQQMLPDETEVYYIAMRLLTGGSLADRLKAGTPFTLAQIMTLVDQIASALDYAHRRGVIHRDLKPGNVMFDEQGSAYLVDFGIARLEHQETITETGTALGTPGFMSPEQWRGEAMSPAADQYALAVLVYRMLTGLMPFEAQSPYTMMYRHLNELPPAASSQRPGLPPAIDAVLHQAMAKTAAQRYPAVTAFADALRTALTGQDAAPTHQLRPGPSPAAAATIADAPTTAAVLPRQTSPAMPAANTTDGRRFPVWLAGIVVLLLAGVGLLALSQSSPPEAAVGGTSESAPTAFTATATSTDSGTPFAAQSADLTAEAYIEQGTRALAGGDCSRALEAFNQAIALDPDQDVAYLSRAYCLADIGDAQAGAADALRYIATHQQEVIEGDILLRNAPQTLELTFGRVYRLPTALTTGQRVGILVNQVAGSVDPLVVLLAPDGTPLIHNDDLDLSGGDFNSLIRQFAVTEAGTYTVVVTHAAGGATGTVEVTLAVIER